MRASLAVLIPLLSCGDAPQEVLWIGVTPEEAPMVRDWVASIGDDRLRVVQTPRPLGVSWQRIALVPTPQDASQHPEAYTLRADARGLVVEGATLRARLYGTAAALEEAGWRFPHPARSILPRTVQLPTRVASPGEPQAPQMDRRGLHMHTLHPIEGLIDFWMPEHGGADRAKAVIDWVVRQRGNHVQWVALDNIKDDPDARDAWRDHTRDLVSYTHQLGLTAGVGIQLFGSGNLQQAYHLLDVVGPPDAQADAVRQRIRLISEGIPWDVLNLSFGEFFAEAPERFIESATIAYDAMQEVLPGVDVPTVVHVGADLEVSYEGDTFLYYFLPTRTDRAYKPWIHTVMYYNLFEDAGGAYHHDAFDEHRDFLLNALKAEEPVGYFPESGYWVAFDNSVPNYFPLYLRSRWTDIARIDAFAAEEGVPSLKDQVLFSTGWEWGHWQFDLSVLRDSWRRTDSFCAPLEHTFGVFGAAGIRYADAACELADLQHIWLLQQRLTPWIASWDDTMQFGYTQGILGQPQRPLPAEIATWSGEDRATLNRVSRHLSAYATDAEALFSQLPEPGDNRWFREVADGMELAGVRARFAAALVDATRAFQDDEPIEPFIEAADALMEDAAVIVARRHADLHDPEPERLLRPLPNPTIYNFGYLYRSETLCYWRRELAQTRNALLDSGVRVPGCSLELEPEDRADSQAR